MRATVAVAVAAAVTFAGGVTTAATQPSSSAVKACRAASGSLALLHAGKCPKGTRAVTVGQKGAAGAPGPAGDQGPTGNPGAAGPAAVLVDLTVGMFDGGDMSEGPATKVATVGPVTYSLSCYETYFAMASRLSATSSVGFGTTIIHRYWSSDDGYEKPKITKTSGAFNADLAQWGASPEVNGATSLMSTLPAALTLSTTPTTTQIARLEVDLDYNVGTCHVTGSITPSG